MLAVDVVVCPDRWLQEVWQHASRSAEDLHPKFVVIHVSWHQKALTSDAPHMLVERFASLALHDLWTWGQGDLHVV